MQTCLYLPRNFKFLDDMWVRVHIRLAHHVLMIRGLMRVTDLILVPCLTAVFLAKDSAYTVCLLVRI